MNIIRTTYTLALCMMAGVVVSQMDIRNYALGDYTKFNEIVGFSDSHFIVTGRFDPGPNIRAQGGAWLFTNEGHIVCDFSISDALGSRFQEVVVGPDDLIVVGGSSEFPDTIQENFQTAVVVGVNICNQQIWRYDLPGVPDSRVSSITVSAEGEIYVIGYRILVNSPRPYSFVVKLDNEGQEIWVKDSLPLALFYDLALLPEGGIVVMGLEAAGRFPSGNTTFMKFTSNGTIDTTITTGQVGSFGKIKILPNGDFLTCGSYRGDARVARFTNTGELIWEQTFGGDEGEGLANAVLTATGVVIAGYTYSNTPTEFYNSDIFIAAVSYDGELEWTRQFGGPNNEEGTGIIASERGFIISGFNEQAKTGLIIRIDSMGNLTSTSRIPAPSPGIKVYPNPTEDRIWLDLPTTAKWQIEVVISAADGRIVLKQSVTANDASVGVAHLPSGVYLVTALNNKASHLVGKFIKH